MRDILADYRRQDRVRETGAIAFGCCFVLTLSALIIVI